MSGVTIAVKYRLGHTVRHDYKPCDLFCPNCGKQTVWQEQDPGDYYVGEDYYCTSCAHRFTIQGPNGIPDDVGEASKQILDGLRARETEEGRP